MLEVIFAKNILINGICSGRNNCHLQIEAGEELDNAQKSLENVTTRLEKIRLQRHITLATRNWEKTEESLFMDNASLDIELEKRNRQKFKVERLFILEIRGI